MSDYVKDGNSCIGCESLDEFPELCGSCGNFKGKIEIAKTLAAVKLESQSLTKSNERLVEALEKITEGWTMKGYDMQGVAKEALDTEALPDKPKVMPDDYCCLCYHPKEDADTCSRPDCGERPDKNTENDK